ncbi:MAG: hypothetical protein AAFU81_01580 [Pseudomonadota bacterium]
MRVWIQLDLDPKDVASFEKRVEAIILKYGETPQPHQKKEFEEALQQAAHTLGQCVQAKAILGDG